ncbi:TetR/AcrR family transcriptional regulator [Rhodococcus sp. NPDC003382]|uniref:TetR/AcrR family transcriptional regulator n=1 Tax=unclassified Rhodococcus (in: high G+C Gram-positive bacteria) TaxID=192944 RepID=UPI001E39FF45|nr:MULTISPECIES: TetR/AcrR family transcriptional regulator [unclassified Rhodococcus (in: high G+C Gram-positive bacteria)]MCK8673310.1 TetR/AcrR family transcriptional regulator [Rhodococcus sp. HM1]
MSDKHENSGRVRDAVRTRAALLDAAQEIFLRDGYAAAATEEIVVQAGVTRGALYHHFANKRELFRGVIERIQLEAEETLGKQDPETSEWESFSRAILATLDTVYAPATRRLLLIEAPAVLGWTEVRETHRHTSIRRIEHSLRAIARENGDLSEPSPVMAHLLLAAIEEAMLYLAHSDDPVRDRPEVEAQLMRLLDVVRPVPVRGIA